VDINLEKAVDINLEKAVDINLEKAVDINLEKAVDINLEKAADINLEKGELHPHSNGNNLMDHVHTLLKIIVKRLHTSQLKSSAESSIEREREREECS